MKLERKFEDYEVGYGRPPSDTQFKKGQSGNPKGKPRAVKNLGDVIAKEVLQFINVREGEKISKCTKLNVLIKRTVERGLKGDLRATKYLFDTMEKLRIFDRPEFRSEAHVKMANDLFDDMLKMIRDLKDAEGNYIDVSKAVGEDALDWIYRNFEELMSSELIKPDDNTVLIIRHKLPHYKFNTRNKEKEENERQEQKAN